MTHLYTFLGGIIYVQLNTGLSHFLNLIIHREKVGFISWDVDRAHFCQKKANRGKLPKPNV